MVFVPAGSFQMGSDYRQQAYARAICRQYVGSDATAQCRAANYGDESPAHLVTLESFWIDRMEVTNAQYALCVASGACSAPGASNDRGEPTNYADSAFIDHPVVMVSLSAARSYCGWAGGRLPTEAEWEYAARGPSGLIFPWGDAFDGTRLNYCDLTCSAGPNDPVTDDGYPRTAPVGSFPTGASWVGALDMAGNVREWVADWYGPYTANSQTEPTVPVSGTLNVPRGGSWLDNPSLVRSANRGGNQPGYSRDYYGFRCADD